MALTIGTQLGSHEITALLGQGGMGEVYRARDLKLKREVAIKILPEEFSPHADRVSRFQREAEVLASLNHPNIAAIHDLEETNGTRYLVLELVGGETLADRIAHGPIGVKDILNIALQICEVLEAAHERGIVHRDLKPANIKVTADGRVKVLDFGLAKALEAGPTNAVSSNSPTLLSGTMGGVLIGTAAYMSPEQAVGRAVDRRADIWAFGVVLWEMLTGHALFDGETASHILADVIRTEINFQKLPQTTPPSIRELLKRCLDRDVRNRLRDIGEARVTLSRALTAPPVLPEVVKSAAPAHAVWVWAVSAITLAGVLGFVLWRQKAPENRLVTTTILPPENSSFDFSNLQAPPVLSPDGLRIVYGAHGTDGKTQLWIRRLDSPKAQPLADTDGGMFPFWSPDSKSIAFFAGSKLKKLDVAGGTTITLADVPYPLGGSWSRDGVILFSPNNGPLRKVAAAGGAVSDATTLDKGKDLAHWFPFFLPDGRHFVFVDRTSDSRTKAFLDLKAGSLDGEPVRKLGEADSAAIYSDGYLLYLRGTTLMAQPFDQRSVALQGDALPVAEQVAPRLFTAAHGLLAYANEATAGTKLMWFGRDGKPTGALGDAANFAAVELSPNERNVAVSLAEIGGKGLNIWIFDTLRGFGRRLTFDTAGDVEPAWSPRGEKIAFNSVRHGHRDIYVQAADSPGTEKPALVDDVDKVLPDWSPDGKFLLYTSTTSASDFSVSVLPMTPPGKSYTFLQSPAGSKVLTRWRVGGLYVRGNQIRRDLCRSLPWARRQTADFEGRRVLSAVASGRQRDFVRWAGLAIDGR